MNAAEPHTRDPAGAPSPFDRQNETESNPSTQRAAGMPLATTAFHRRAPSRCSRKVPLFGGGDDRASAPRTGRSDRRTQLCVFSSATPVTGA